MSHVHPVYDTDQYFSVNVETKDITYMGDEIPVLAQGDHVSERYTFEMPRYIDDHDMMQCDVVQVHYINTSANKIEKSVDVYPVNDLQVDSEDENKVLFTWLVSASATQYVGGLSFALRFACTTNSRIDYAWLSHAYTKISVSETINNSETFVEYYSDILQQWYDELVMAGTTGVNVVVEARDEALDKIATALEDIATASEGAQSAIGQATTEAVEKIGAVETIREIEQETLDTFASSKTAHLAELETAKEEAIIAVQQTESETIEKQKQQLISEVVSRILFSGSVKYPSAEEASF